MEAAARCSPAINGSIIFMTLSAARIMRSSSKDPSATRRRTDFHSCSMPSVVVLLQDIGDSAHLEHDQMRLWGLERQD